MYTRQGKCSSFGGSQDTGVGKTETLALYPLTLARKLDEPIYNQNYCAMRWDYRAIQKALGVSRNEALVWLRHQEILVCANGATVACVPVDYGPARSTGRLIDLGPKVLEVLRLATDDIVSVALPDACALAD
jgi:hypothetical protein